jgi:hypothetical protein
VLRYEGRILAGYLEHWPFRQPEISKSWAKEAKTEVEAAKLDHGHDAGGADGAETVPPLPAPTNRST